MQPEPAPALATPEWQQTSLLPPSEVTIFLRVILSGPDHQARLSTTVYSGDHLETLEAISCQDVSLDEAISGSIDMIRCEINRQLRYISPF